MYISAYIFEMIIIFRRLQNVLRDRDLPVSGTKVQPALPSSIGSPSHVLWCSASVQSYPIFRMETWTGKGGGECEKYESVSRVLWKFGNSEIIWQSDKGNCVFRRLKAGECGWYMVNAGDRWWKRVKPGDRWWKRVKYGEIWWKMVIATKCKVHLRDFCAWKEEIGGK